MNFIQSKQSSSDETINLFYEETGTGQPVIFIHGWPSSHEMWEYQINEIASRGFRCIAYDRRGFGKSDKPLNGYDYDSLAADLKAVIDQLNLENVILVGFSMGGGEVARYLGRYGSERISKAVLISAVTPYLLKTDDNPDGVPAEIFEQMAENIKDDRPAFLEDFGKNFFGVGLLNNPVSQPLLNWANMLTLNSTQPATLQCMVAFSETDFRQDMKAFTVPTLIIHGDSDKIVPIQPTSEQSASMIAHAKYIVYEGAPHGLFITEKENLNSDLLEFFNQQEPVMQNEVNRNQNHNSF
ncbi:MAG: alpha/beta hydrolase [Flavobacterium sp.]|nr:alpha/beta hydrolase [Pedobacter sp.]